MNFTSKRSPFALDVYFFENGQISSYKEHYKGDTKNMKIYKEFEFEEKSKKQHKIITETLSINKKMKRAIFKSPDSIQICGDAV